MLDCSSRSEVLHLALDVSVICLEDEVLVNFVIWKSLKEVAWDSVKDLSEEVNHIQKD